MPYCLLFERKKTQMNIPKQNQR